MDLTLALLQLGVGLACLLGGAELFTEQGVKAAKALGITTLGLGLIFAGAEPEEMFTAAIASFQGSPGIAVGDVVGTNITVVTLALGLAAIIVPVATEKAMLKHTWSTLLAAVPAVAFLVLGRVPAWGGVVLIGCYCAYIWYVVYRERLPLAVGEVGPEVVREMALGPTPGARKREWLAPAGLVLLSLAIMGAGGSFTVNGARGLAASFGVTESAIGFSIVALATSAEMLFLATVPALKGHPEIGLGGILGSYAYNATMTLGVASLAGPLVVVERGMTAMLSVFMLGVLLLLPLLARKGVLRRGEGLSLVALYGAFLALVVIGLWK